MGFRIFPIFSLLAFIISPLVYGQQSDSSASFEIKGLSLGQPYKIFYDTIKSWELECLSTDLSKHRNNRRTKKTELNDFELPMVRVECFTANSNYTKEELSFLKHTGPEWVETNLFLFCLFLKTCIPDPAFANSNREVLIEVMADLELADYIADTKNYSRYRKDPSSKTFILGNEVLEVIGPKLWISDTRQRQAIPKEKPIL